MGETALASTTTEQEDSSSEDTSSSSSECEEVTNSDESSSSESKHNANSVDSSSSESELNANSDETSSSESEDGSELDLSDIIHALEDVIEFSEDTSSEEDEQLSIALAVSASEAAEGISSTQGSSLRADTHPNDCDEDEMLAKAMSLSLMDATEQQGSSLRADAHTNDCDEDEMLAKAMSLSLMDATEQQAGTSGPDAETRQAAAGGSNSRQAESSGISKDLECPVCYDLFRKATTLGCGHTFCFVCVERASIKRRNGKCPVCRAPVESVSHCVALDNVIKSLASGAGQ